MIELKGVNKVYELGGEKIYALANVNLKVEEGEFLAVMGPSGSGKSTLANIIGGLDTPDSGTIRIDEQDLATLNDRKLSAYRNAQVGFVFQTFNLQPSYTALENVVIPLALGGMPGKERIARATECLRAVGLEDRVNHRPSQLSGGQRQRVCIARALANNPKIIIADEPTGNLDSSRGREIIALLETLNKKGITIIIITHDPTIAKVARKVIRIKDGKVES